MATVTKNTLITSVDLFVDIDHTHLTLHLECADDVQQITHTHLTLHLEYADTVQQTGLLLLNDKILRFLSHITGERRPTLIKDKPCRVRIDDECNEIIEIGHFLKNDWLPLK